MNIKKDCIVLDCDGILLDYNRGISSYASKTRNITTEGLCTGYLDEWLGISPESTDDLVTEFNTEAEDFRNLHPMVPALPSYIKELSLHTNLVVCTKSGKGGTAIENRKFNLLNVFGDVFDDIYIVEPNESKRQALLDIQMKYNIKCFVDDLHINVSLAQKMNICTVMYSTSDNQRYINSGQYQYKDTWEELYAYLLNLVK